MGKCQLHHLHFLPWNPRKCVLKNSLTTFFAQLFFSLPDSIWYMGLTDAALTIVFFNLFCSLPVAMFSTWGKTTGLRQMVLTRFSFGRWGQYFPGKQPARGRNPDPEIYLSLNFLVLLNCIACIGWSVVNTIVGASTLRAVGETHKLPSAAGIVIIAVLTACAALFGYKYVHAFERYASIPIIVRSMLWCL